MSKKSGGRSGDINLGLRPSPSFSDYHTAPRRQYSISLTGSVELGLPDGTLKQYGPGTVLLAEDMTGTGHSTRVIGEEDRFTIIIPLSD